MSQRNTLLFGAALAVTTAAITYDTVTNPVPPRPLAQGQAVAGGAPCAAGAAPCAAGTPQLAPPPPPAQPPATSGLRAAPPPPAQPPAAEVETPALQPPPPPPATKPANQEAPELLVEN